MLDTVEEEKEATPKLSLFNNRISDDPFDVPTPPSDSAQP